MQDEVIFPTCGIDGNGCWRRWPELVGKKGCDGELAYQLSIRAGRFPERQSSLCLLVEQMVDEIASRIVEQRCTAIETGTIREPRH